jgi:hypothetical protein
MMISLFIVVLPLTLNYEIVVSSVIALEIVWVFKINE